MSDDSTTKEVTIGMDGELDLADVTAAAVYIVELYGGVVLEVVPPTEEDKINRVVRVVVSVPDLSKAGGPP